MRGSFGGAVGKGTTPTIGLSAIFLGNLVLVVVGALVGVIGYRTGLTSYSLARIVFGKRGSVLVSSILGIIAMGYVGVLMDGFASALNVLVPSIPKLSAVLAFSLLVTLTCLYGFKGLSWMSVIAVPALWILIGWALFSVAGKVGSLGAIFEYVPEKDLGFNASLGAAIATWIAGAVIVSDITRYARRASGVVWSAIAVYIFGSFLLEAVSTLTAAGLGESDVVAVMAKLGLLVPGLLVLVLALWTTTNSNIYSTALALTNAGNLAHVKLSMPIWTMIAILIAISISLLGLASQFLSWLRVVATVAAPFAGVIVFHFWVLHKGLGMGPTREGIRWEAFVAWISASVFSYYYKASIPALPGMILAGFLYLLLNKIGRWRGEESTSENR